MSASNVSDMKAGAAGDSARLRFLRIPDDGILSGDALFHVTFTDDSSWGEQLTLYFDGKVYTHTRAFPEASADQQTLGKEVGDFGIATYLHTNTPHQLEVRDNFGNSSSRSVIFRNVISSVTYGPIFDLTPGAEDIEDKSHITAILTPAQRWEAKIINLEGEVVKSFSGSGAEIDVFWDGTDINGEVVEDSSYTLAIAAVESGVSILAGHINKNSL